MCVNDVKRWPVWIAVATAFVLGGGRAAFGAERLCDPAYEDCRAPILQLIQNETVGIDVAFWFMEDSRFSSAIISRWNAGVPVRVLLDPRGDASHPDNATVRAQLVAAGIPIRVRTASGILHWKTMLFAGQNTVEFSGANYSPFEFLPVTPYANYEDEAVYFSDDPAVVNSFKTKWDDLWTDTTSYADFANIVPPLVRIYPTFTIDSSLDFPPGSSSVDYANKCVARYNKETQKIDVAMFRITDQRHTNAIIAAAARGVQIRLITEQEEYRNPDRLWDAWNVDRLWAAGIAIRQRGHAGLNHQKSILLYSQALTIFGSSNWTSPSANSQQEHNYFTTKPWIFQWFVDQFERKWNNLGPSPETAPFAPLPPDKPTYLSPANLTVGVSTATATTLKWDGGPWAHVYDVYFGVDPNPPLFAANLNLGPTDPASPKATQKFVLPAIQPGTTYYWRIVSRTMAGLTASGPTYSFTTAGSPPPPPPPPPGTSTIVIWAKDVPPGNVFGSWQFLSDASAAGSVALWLPDRGTAKISPPLAGPSNYFDLAFSATAGVPYHMWIRMRAQGNSLSNDSVSVQFDDSVDAFGSPMWRIGSTTGAEVLLRDGSTASISAWGWADSGFGTFGPDVYFSSTGQHTLRLQQRDDGAIVDQIVISPDTYVRAAPGAGTNDATILGSTISGEPAPPPPPPLPSPWVHEDVGTVGVPGSATYDAATGQFTIVAGGADIWGSADAMHLAYQPLTGDGSIVARVVSLQNTSTSAKAGVVVRESLAPGAANAAMLLTAGKGLAFQRRFTTGGSTVTSVGALSPAPYWVRLDRAGDTFSAYQSVDGSTWTLVGTDTVVMGPSVYIGMEATSHTVAMTTTAKIDRVSVTMGTYTPPPPPPPLPDPWQHADIGAVGVAGGATFDSASSTFTVKGAGADVWGTADALHYAYMPLVGDGALVARAASIQNTASWAKAGVMIRETLDPGSAQAFALVSFAKGVAFQRRDATGATSVSTAGPLVSAPYWIKLERQGDTFTASASPDGATWTVVGTDTIPMAQAVYVGLAVSSHTTSATATATFDSVH